ncbi:MAG TPA: glycogen debranching N-terminal domain-containing protein [Solirubrobacteraceae bacterium]|nr:glycogen debranching N-terminal domain-containing protein [Solirubrobacteraceae bacterium]
MADQAISVLDGNTFVVSDTHGDLRPSCRLPPHGFFSEDTRFVSQWELTVSGRGTELLSAAQVHYFVAQFFLVPPTTAFHAASPLSLVRRRIVKDVWLEELLLSNHSEEPLDVAIDLAVAADFADLFEVKDGQVREREVTATAENGQLVLRYRRGSFLRETRIAVSGPATIEPGAVRLRASLTPREERTVTFVLTPYGEQPGRASVTRRPVGTFEEIDQRRRTELDAWLTLAPAIETDGDALGHVYDQSLVDLAALRFHPHVARQDVSLPAAGLPWFMSLFGRDSIITSLQALPYQPDLARTTLRTLAARQGTTVDAFRDQEPGKILHEIRFGELTTTRERPHSPYYGTADATPLYLVLLDEYERWSGDADLVRELEPNARAALDWIDHHGDRDGDGYVEYMTRNPASGLVNQCWKDSWNSMMFSDGRIAQPPIATCEIQGYVYDAKRRAARLARSVWEDEALADRLEAEAAELRRRFHDDFWIPDRAFFALALDGDKQPVDSLTSNIGHLLWSGIVEPEHAEALVRHLLGDALYSGWGVRTMAAGDAGYNPIEYHNGTVWPHDNSLIAAGLRRYGFRAEAARIAGAIVGASSYFDYRLPEVFAGWPAAMTEAPVEYPTASRPQAWAAAAPLLALTTVLGLSPGAGGPECDPHLPEEFGAVALRGVPGRWGRADLSVPASGAPQATAVRRASWR